MKEKSNENNNFNQQSSSGKRRWLIAAAVAMVALLLAGGLWYFLRDGKQEPSSAMPDSSQSGGTNQQTEPIGPSDTNQQTQPSQEQDATQPSEPTDGNDPTQPTSQTTMPSGGEDQPTSSDVPTQPSEGTESGKDTQPSGENQQGGTESPSGNQDEPENTDGYITFIQGISVSPVQKYTGMYMEDGSNELVSDIMMMIVRNDTSSDLQLARIEVQYSDFTAEFQVTNLPAGKSAVVLEKNRKAFTEEEHRAMNINDVVFFQEKMTLCADRVKVSGSKGVLDIENISSETFGVVYVYFKNTASDGLLYGGITYRTTIEAGLKPGETKRVMAGHYDPELTTIMLVQIAENVT